MPDRKPVVAPPPHQKQRAQRIALARAAGAEIPQAARHLRRQECASAHTKHLDFGRVNPVWTEHGSVSRQCGHVLAQRAPRTCGQLTFDSRNGALRSNVEPNPPLKQYLNAKSMTFVKPRPTD